nr:MAG TPA: hypothetical protein [Caudoviricetes sp.]
MNGLLRQFVAWFFISANTNGRFFINLIVLALFRITNRI